MYSKSEHNPIVANKVFLEIIASEKTYNLSLTLMEQVLSNDDLIKDSELLRELKKLILPLKNISDGLVTNVEKAVNTQTTDGSALRKQREQLLTAFFKAFKPYAELFEQFCIENQKNPQQFKDIEDLIKTLSDKNLKLQDHLIQPIQRGPRYKILMDALEKMNEHLDETNLDEFAALKILVGESLNSINRSIATQSASPTKQYQFGDYTWALLGWDRPKTPEPQNNQTSTEEVKPAQVYKFGDLTRGVIAFFQSK